jgi:hypothetical protein
MIRIRGTLMKAWHAVLVGILLALTMVHTTVAEVPLAPSRAQSDLAWLFPNFAQLPAGMMLAEEGSRSAAEIAATFRDPVDVGMDVQCLPNLCGRSWGWAANTGSPRGLAASVCVQHRGRLCPAVLRSWPRGDVEPAGRTDRIFASLRGGGHGREGRHAVSADRGSAGAGDRGDAEHGSCAGLLLGARCGHECGIRGPGKCWRVRARA